jgi:nicotinamidase-related amidase
LHDTALLVIDVQKGLDEPRLGRRNNPDAEANMAALLAAWRARGLPVVHVHHDSVQPDSPLRPGLPGNEVKDEVRPLPAEAQFRKSVNSAFIGTGLEAYLQQRGLTSLVVGGLTTEHCVSTTVRMAANLGFDVTLIDDATAAFEHRGRNGEMHSADAVHRVNIASLDGEFCAVRTTAQLLRDLGPGADAVAARG